MPRQLAQRRSPQKLNWPLKPTNNTAYALQLVILVQTVFYNYQEHRKQSIDIRDNLQLRDSSRDGAGYAGITGLGPGQCHTDR